MLTITIALDKNPAQYAKPLIELTIGGLSWAEYQPYVEEASKESGNIKVLYSGSTFSIVVAFETLIDFAKYVIWFDSYVKENGNKWTLV